MAQRIKINTFVKVILIIVCVTAAVCAIWIVFSLAGRVDAAEVIPNHAVVRISIPNLIRVIDGIMEHETMHEISSVPALSGAAPAINLLHDTQVHKKKFFRNLLHGRLEAAVLPSHSEKMIFAAAYDLKLFSPAMKFFRAASAFLKIPGLYYVRAGGNSRFEYRMEKDMTLFIGSYRNLLFVSNTLDVFESRSADYSILFNYIKPEAYDASLLVSSEYINNLFSGQDTGIATILENIKIDSIAEAGILITSRKFEFDLKTHLSSGQSSLKRLLEQRSRSPYMTENIPSSARYATVLSAGTLQELYQSAIVFSGSDLENTFIAADSASRSLLGLSINDILFSWSGKEFAVFGMEGRSHPVFAVQIADERNRQDVFEKAFRSIFPNEDIRLNSDGARMTRIVVPEFLQNLLRRWNIFIPSPYYAIHGDILLLNESADTLLSVLREMQGYNVLPKTSEWQAVAGGKPAASAFSLYYSLDLSVPFFLRRNTALSAFLSLYRQGLVRLSFNSGLASLSFSLVPGSGNGVTLVSGYPLDIGGNPSSHVYAAGKGANARLFFASGSSAFSVSIADNSIYELERQGTQWVISAEGIGKADDAYAWIVSDRGRVTLADGNMKAAEGFPVVTGLRISSAPQVFNGKVYLCDEEGKIHTINEKGVKTAWRTSFISAVRSPPSFLSVQSGRVTRNYAAVYPKSFFGEIWLLDADSGGDALAGWPAPISVYESSAVGFGSPILFAHNGSVYAAFVCQTGELVIYDENGYMVKPFPADLGGSFYLQPVFDGEYLWLVSAEGTLYRVSMQGELLSQNIPGFSVKEEGHIAVFDCDNDRIPEIFITGDGSALYAFTRNFRSLEGFPLPAWGKPLFVEARSPLTNRRKAEIFGMGADRRLYRWQFR